VCHVLNLVVLILDSQATGAGRFVAQGPPDSSAHCAKYFVILHRTRRQHYNYITLQGKALFERHELPTAVAQMWGVVGPGDGGGRAQKGAGGLKEKIGGGKGKRLRSDDISSESVIAEGRTKRGK